MAHLSRVTDVLRRADELAGQPAVECAAGTTSWAALAGLVGELAGTLHAAGARPGDRIGVALAPGRDALAAALAAHWLGCAYVPFDPDLPDARIAAMLEQCRPAVTVADPGRSWGGHRTLAVADREAGATAPAPHSAQPAEVAYVIHTSGSTGTPRAIEVTHGNLDNLLVALDQLGPVPERSRGSWWSRPSFDVAVWESWAPLVRGGTVAVVPDEDRLEPDRLVGFLDRAGIASCYLPPTYLGRLRDHLADRPDSHAGLRLLLVGVEPIPLGLLGEIAALRPAATVLNGYGPAEATVCCTVYRVPPAASGAGRTPIGTAIPGARVYLTDPAGQPADEGELVVAGAGVARGYLAGEPDPPRFIPDPAGRPGERAYRTGDRARRLPDGNLEFLGRLDRQLKVRGYRIEPAEVEAAVRAVLPVREVVVGAREVPGAGPAVVAYLVPQPGVRLDRAAFTAALRERLPGYAVPAAVLELPDLPQTSNGKIDYDALAGLPMPDDAGEPSDELSSDESALGTVLRLSRRLLHQAVRPGDRLLDLGATSLTATRLAAELRAETGRAVGAHDVLTAASVDELAALLEAAPADEVTGANGADRAPLTGSQLGLWLHEQLTEDGALYVESYACELAVPPAELPMLVRAVERAIGRHRVFGALVEGDEVPTMVLADRPVPVERLPLPEDPDQLLASLRDEARRPFDLDRGPLMRARLLVGIGEAADRVVAQFCWHHLAVDGWTLRLFLDEVAAWTAGGGDDRAPAGLTYCDLLLRLAGREPDAERLESLLGGLAAAVRAADWLPTEPGSTEPDRISPVPLPPAVQRRLLAVPGERGVAAVLVAALSDALAAVGGMRRPVLAFATAGRQLPGSERVAGYLVDAVLLDCADADQAANADRTAETDNADRLARTGAAIGAALAAQQDLPLTRLVRELRQRLAGAAGPVLPVVFPQVYFSLDDLPEPALFGRRVRQIPLRLPRARFPVAFSVQRGPDRVEAWLELSGTLPAAIRDRLPDALAQAVAALVPVSEG